MQYNIIINGSCPMDEGGLISYIGQILESDATVRSNDESKARDNLLRSTTLVGQSLSHPHTKVNRTAINTLCDNLRKWHAAQGESVSILVSRDGGE